MILKMLVRYLRKTLDKVQLISTDIESKGYQGQLDTKQIGQLKAKIKYILTKYK